MAARDTHCGSLAPFAPESERPRSWRDDAKCQGVAIGGEYNPFWDDTLTKFEAELLCAGCPVKRECINDARLYGGYGVRGGMLESAWR